MTETEMRELDAWIAEHVMGLALWKETPEQISCILEPDQFVLSIPRKIVRARIGENPTINFEPTVSRSQAMLILGQCAEKAAGREIAIRKCGQTFTVGICDWYYEKVDLETSAETLPLAICLFAKKLFS